MTTVKVHETREIKLTKENELSIIEAEFSRRYDDCEFEVGDAVRFTDSGNWKQQDLMGGDHVGRHGIVVAPGQEGRVKVLTITLGGDFFEVWTDVECVELVG